MGSFVGRKEVALERTFDKVSRVWEERGMQHPKKKRGSLCPPFLRNDFHSELSTPVKGAVNTDWVESQRVIGLWAVSCNVVSTPGAVKDLVNQRVRFVG